MLPFPAQLNHRGQTRTDAMDDFLYIPNTPQPDEKRSKYNPFMRALRLDNLPPAVKPGHLTHILTHPPTGHGQAKRRQESGVSL